MRNKAEDSKGSWGAGLLEIRWPSCLNQCPAKCEGPGSGALGSGVNQSGTVTPLYPCRLTSSAPSAAAPAPARSLQGEHVEGECLPPAGLRPTARPPPGHRSRTAPPALPGTAVKRASAMPSRRPLAAPGQGNRGRISVRVWGHLHALCPQRGPRQSRAATPLSPTLPSSSDTPSTFYLPGRWNHPSRRRPSCGSSPPARLARLGPESSQPGLQTEGQAAPGMQRAESSMPAAGPDPHATPRAVCPAFLGSTGLGPGPVACGAWGGGGVWPPLPRAS